MSDSEKSQALPQNDSIIIDFPLRGTWKAIRSPGHDRFAFDFAALSGEGRRMLPAPQWRYFFFHLPVNHSFSWGQPVYSPGPGLVIQSQDGWPDRTELNLLSDLRRLLFTRPRIEADDVRPFAGNYVVLRLEGGFAFLAHLRSGSVRVKAGQSVSTGEFIGEVGHSGFTLAPHLHFQVMDAAHPISAWILPFRVSRLERWTGHDWEIVENATLSKGELIRARG
jgi:murein DD-endopeptidase MepM/ murein hydrolase activator NlpD